ncbi:MAG: hypothetical protein DWC00_00475 [Candidatus Poseidoniales archaeon]|nr:MAG: hypothetical protein DWC00_00475 [Candidatus Poseidoniales archaeon]
MKVMARQLLQQCTVCQAWCLEITCPQCGGRAQAAAPLKWSPEDHRAKIRRTLNNVETPEWSASIPTLASVQELRAGQSNKEEE